MRTLPGYLTVSTGIGPNVLGKPLLKLIFDTLSVNQSPFRITQGSFLETPNLQINLLLALASGNYRSEIHVWMNRNIHHKEDWSKISLCPVPSFLFKNQLVHEGPDSVNPGVIPALAPTLDKSLKEDRSHCPVRALRCYLHKTKDLKDNKLLVSVPFKKNFDRDFSPHAISS